MTPSAAAMYASDSKLQQHAARRLVRAEKAGDHAATAVASNDLLNSRLNMEGLAPIILDEVERVALGLPIQVPTTMEQAPL